MKLAFRQIDPFVQNPDPHARVILVYGPDQGLMSERATLICQSVIADLNDPFNVAYLTTESVLSDPASFYDEAQAQSLMGGNRLIIIRGGTDSLAPILKDYLDTAPSQHNLVVIEAGDLGPRSALRKLMEGAKNAAAVPCYVDDERTISQIIRDMCSHAGYSIEPAGIMILSSALIGDRAIARGEIEKLLLYKGLDPDYKGFSGNPIRKKMGVITAADAIASTGDTRDWTMDTLVYDIGDGNVTSTHTIIDSLFRDQIAPIILLRSMQNHLWRLYSVNTKIKAGMTQADAIKTLQPTLFFKVEDAFKRQLNRWSVPVLESALDSINKTEILTKKTGYDAESVTKNCLIQLARYNPRMRRPA